MESRKCKNCGNTFMAYPSSKRRFCSRRCSTISAWSNREKAQIVKVKCAFCGKDFDVYARDSRVKDNKIKYCGTECRDNALKKGVIRQCAVCGKEFYSTRNFLCSRDCASKYRSISCLHKTYYEKGYEVKHIKGYNKRGNAKVHRLVVEEHIGRRLSSDEIVHHIDGNKLNNDISNLQVMTRGEHSSLHRRQQLQQGNN